MASSDKIYCSSPEMVRLVESTDLRCAQALQAGLSEAQKAARSLKTFECDGAYVDIQTKPDGERAGRVIGFENDRMPTDSASFDRIIAAVHAENVDSIHFTILPCPNVKEIVAWLNAAGFQRRQRSVHWTISTANLPTPDFTHDIRRATELSDLERFARMVAVNYHYKPGADLSRLMEQFASPHAACFLAFENEEPIATGSMTLVGDSCALGYGTTMGPYRKRGIQGEMIAARLRHAKESSCDWATASTMGYDRSSRNIVRQGFTRAYESLPFVWRRSAA